MSRYHAMPETPGGYYGIWDCQGKSWHTRPILVPGEAFALEERLNRDLRFDGVVGFVSPQSLRPVVPVTDTGAEATCPRCQTVNQVGFAGNGDIEWWPDRAKGHCVHFKGVYSTGDFRSVQASFL